MSRTLRKRFFFLIVLFLGSVWWIHSRCFNCSSQEREKDITLNDNSIGYNKEEKVATSHIDIHIEIIPHDSDAKSNEIYPLVIADTPESAIEMEEYDSSEAYKDDEKCLEELKQKLQGDTSTKNIVFEEDFLKLCLLHNNNEIDRAFYKIQNFLKLKESHGYFFSNINFDFTQNPAYRFATILPRRRRDGSVTILFEVAKWDPDVVPFEHFKKIMFMIYVQALRNPLTQTDGFSFICDFTNAGFRYVKYTTPTNMLLLNHILAEVITAKFVGIHLINVNFIGNLLVTIGRPFLPPFIEKILYLHSSADELLDYFSKSMLPAQYGGNLTDYYMEDWIRKANEEHSNFSTGGQKNIF